jgi:hypothetical protein
MITEDILFPIFVRQGNSRTRFKVGYINRTGNVAIDSLFDEGTNFYEGLASVKMKNRWGVIDLKGNFIIEPKMWNWCRFHDGFASLATRNGKWGVIDRDGEFVIQPRYDYVGAFKDELALFRIGEMEKARYGFLDKHGREVIAPIFHDASQFSEGLAAAKVGNLWGYLAASGVFQITPRFDGSGKSKRFPDMRAGRFSGGLAPVWVGQDNYRFIDTVGAFAFDGTFDDANTFCENRAVVRKHNHYGFIDTSGKLVIEYEFTSAKDFSEGLARVKIGKDKVGALAPWGFIDSRGNVVLRPLFNDVLSFREGLCLVEAEDSIGYINRLGDFIWQGPYVEYGVVL